MFTRSLISVLKDEETNIKEDSIKRHFIHSLNFQRTGELSIKLHDVFVMLNVDTIQNHVE